jgi:hypothetical protein
MKKKSRHTWRGRKNLIMMVSTDKTIN